MKKIALLIVLIPFVMCLIAPSSALAVTGFPNIFKPDDRVPADSEINPWDMVSWNLVDYFLCPEGDVDTHLVFENPDPKGEIKKVEMVVGDGRMLPRGTLCSYSYMDNGKWRLFIYDLDKEKFLSKRSTSR